MKSWFFGKINNINKLLAIKLDNLEEMDKITQPSQRSHEELENRKRPITTKETETVIKNLRPNKSPGPGSFSGEFHQIFKEDLAPILLNSSQILKRRKYFLTHFVRPPLH